MKNSLPLITAALSLGIASLIAANTAKAGCGYLPPKLTRNSFNSAEQPRAALKRAVYWSETGGRFQRVDDEWGDDAGIVGMWRFEMVTPTPTGPALVDDGYAQWHADGTEIQNSGLQPPKTSNFCLGVWKQIGPRTYQLNHFPMAWDSTGDNPANPVQITATVNLTDNNHFKGSYTLKVYNWDGTELTHAVGPPTAIVQGTISAVRVTINSTVPGAQ